MSGKGNGEPKMSVGHKSFKISISLTHTTENLDYPASMIHFKNETLFKLASCCYSRHFSMQCQMFLENISIIRIKQFLKKNELYRTAAYKT